VSALPEERAVLGLCNTLEEILVSHAEVVDEPLRDNVFTSVFEREAAQNRQHRIFINLTIVQEGGNGGCSRLYRIEPRKKVVRAINFTSTLSVSISMRLLIAYGSFSPTISP
jgi:hypothetical protein